MTDPLRTPSRLANVLSRLHDTEERLSRSTSKVKHRYMSLTDPRTAGGLRRRRRPRDAGDADDDDGGGLAHGPQTVGRVARNSSSQRGGKNKTVRKLDFSAAVSTPPRQERSTPMRVMVTKPPREESDAALASMTAELASLKQLRPGQRAGAFRPVRERRAAGAGEDEDALPFLERLLVKHKTSRRPSTPRLSPGIGCLQQHGPRGMLREMHEDGLLGDLVHDYVHVRLAEFRQRHPAAKEALEFELIQSAEGKDLVKVMQDELQQHKQQQAERDRRAAARHVEELRLQRQRGASSRRLSTAEKLRRKQGNPHHVVRKSSRVRLLGKVLFWAVVVAMFWWLSVHTN